MVKILYRILLVSALFTNLLACSASKGLLLRGDELAAQGKAKQAVAVYIKADAKEPKSVQGHCRAGTLYLDIGKPRAAGKIFKRAIDKKKDSSCAVLGLTKAHIAMGDTQSAMKLLKALKSSDPDNPQVYFLEGVLLKQQGQHDEALTAFARAIRLNSGYSDAHLRTGDIFFLQGKLKEAMQSYSLAARDHANSCEAMIQIGRIYLLEGLPKRGLAALRRAVVIERNNAWAHLYLGEALLHNQQIDKAILALQRALHLNPKLGQAHVRLGQIFEGNMLTRKAYQSFLRAVRVDPKCFEGYLNLARMQLDRNEKNQARRSLQKALKYQPDCVACQVLLARLQIEVRQYLKAVRLLEEIIQTDYQNNQAHFLLGQAYLGLGKIEKAMAEYNALALANEEEMANKLYEMISRKSQQR